MEGSTASTAPEDKFSSSRFSVSGFTVFWSECEYMG
jgi:hypothetical protein